MNMLYTSFLQKLLQSSDIVRREGNLPEKALLTAMIHLAKMLKTQTEIIEKSKG